MTHISKGELIGPTEAHAPLPWSGCLTFDSMRDRDDGYGVVDNVREVVARIDDKGRGLRLKYMDGENSIEKDIIVRDANLRSRAIWFHVAE